MTSAPPVAAETKVTVHVAWPAMVPATRLHGLEAKDPALKVVSVKKTVPAGVVGLASVSVTVAVQLVCSPMATVEGLHETLVVVGCGDAPIVTVRPKMPLLVACVASPPYVPVIVSVRAVVPVGE